eukprot:5533654-Pleurochrysis_carterae.AAC.1
MPLHDGEPCCGTQQGPAAHHQQLSCPGGHNRVDGWVLKSHRGGRDEHNGLSAMHVLPRKLAPLRML